jgi:hypothetical protein
MHLGMRVTIKHLKCLMVVLAHSLSDVWGGGNEVVFSKNGTHAPEMVG